MLLDRLPKPAIIAHRGASAYAPENTLAAFELALRQGADAIELDAKLSADGHIVVFHDQTTQRTTAHEGRIGAMTLNELRKLDAGSHFDISFSGEPIPTLEEVFKAVGQLTYINVELTNYASPTDALPEKVAALVKQHRLSQRVFFSSFNPLALNRVRRLLPDTPVGLLAFSGSRGRLARSWIARLLVPYQSLNPDLSDVTAPLVENAHKRDKKVLVYTVNRQEEMQRLFGLGVDGIFTDDPILARQALDANPAQA